MSNVNASVPFKMWHFLASTHLEMIVSRHRASNGEMATGLAF